MSPDLICAFAVALESLSDELKELGVAVVCRDGVTVFDEVDRDGWPIGVLTVALARERIAYAVEFRGFDPAAEFSHEEIRRKILRGARMVAFGDEHDGDASRLVPFDEAGDVYPIFDLGPFWPEPLPPCNLCMEYRPTLVERFWKWLGFGACPMPRPEPSPEFVEGWMSTELTTYFCWRDRLRILISGRVRIAEATQTNVFVDHGFTTANTSVLPPRFTLKRDGADARAAEESPQRADAEPSGDLRPAGDSAVPHAHSPAAER